MSAPLTRTTRQIFRRRLRENRIGDFELDPLEPCTPRKDVALPISPRDNEGSGWMPPCLGQEVVIRATGDDNDDDKIVIIIAASLSSSASSVFFLLPEVRVRPHLGVKLRRDSGGVERERAAFFRGKLPLRKIISGDTYRFFRASSAASLPVARNHVTDRQPCGQRRRLCRRSPTRRAHFAVVQSFIIQLRGRNFFSE